MKIRYLFALCLSLLAGCGGGIDPTPAPVDFVVRVERAPQPAERFVVRLVRPEQIATARAIVSGRQPSQIVFGSLADGDGGFNRDPVAGRAWSWHMVPESITFVDTTVEIYDGTPSIVEADKAGYLRIGRYGPWGSHVERELP